MTDPDYRIKKTYTCDNCGYVMPRGIKVCPNCGITICTSCKD